MYLQAKHLNSVTAQTDPTLRLEMSFQITDICHFVIETLNRMNPAPSSNNSADREAVRAANLARFGILRTSAVQSLPALGPLKSRLNYTQMPFVSFGRYRIDFIIDSIARVKSLPSQESYLLSRYWDTILEECLLQKDLDMIPEFNIKNELHDFYPAQRVDRALCSNINGRNVPIVLIEAALDPVPFNRAHKDEEKLAVIMAAALLQQMKLLRRRGIGTLNELKIFGVLIGGPGFEICTMNPVIRSFTRNHFEAEFVFVSSRRELRFRMYMNEDESQPAHLVASTYICDGSQPCLRQMTELTQPDSNDVSAESDFQGLVEIYLAKNLNFLGLKIFFRLGELASGNAAFLSRHCRAASSRSSPSSSASGNWLSSSNFLLDDEQRTLMAAMNHSRHSRSESTASNAEPLRRPSEGTRTVRVVPDDEFKSIAVLKAASKYELAVLTSPDISASLCFPKLLAFTLFPLQDDGKELVELELERLLTLREWLASITMRKSELKQLQRQVVLLLAQISEALKCLHDCGFVHGDVSINNVGFNERLGRWQLFDFNQSRPIANAAVNRYHGGTRGFRSFHYEGTGIFTPIDDMVSLQLTVKYVIRKLSEYYPATQEFFEFFEPFDSALAANDINNFDQEIALLKLKIQ